VTAERLQAAAAAIVGGPLLAIIACLAFEALCVRHPVVLDNTRQLLKLRYPLREQPPFDWERPLGAVMLTLGSTGLVFAVMPIAWPGDTPGNNPANWLNLVRWLLVATIPIGLWVVSLAVSRLRLHNDNRVRCLANAVGLPGAAVATRAGRVLLIVLGLSVAFGAATWDLFAESANYDARSLG